MEIALLKTEGRGLVAEISVDGHPLRVADALSSPTQPAAPGPVTGARLDLVVNDALSWERAPAPNLRREKKLVQQWGWRYLGYGQVISTQPVRVDLGIVTLTLDLAVGRSVSAGEFIAIAIDRITLSQTLPSPRTGEGSVRE
jgi:hypothetical protein